MYIHTHIQAHHIKHVTYCYHVNVFKMTFFMLAIIPTYSKYSTSLCENMLKHTQLILFIVQKYTEAHVPHIVDHYAKIHRHTCTSYCSSLCKNTQTHMYPILFIIMQKYTEEQIPHIYIYIYIYT